jgi:hypothetical protein
MSDKLEFSGAVNGMACAFALLIDVLEANGALKPKQFEAELGSVLRHSAGDIGSEIALLNHIMSVLQVPENGTGSA